MTNAIIDQLKNRRSVREFTGSEVKKEDLDIILRAAQRAPSSINGQQVTLIYTRDKNKIKEIVDKCASQPHIATADVFVTFVIDFNRTAYAVGDKHIIEKSAEGIVTGCVDAGIMLSSLQTAAEALGYGTTAIGYVRNNPQIMIDILGLPEKTFPLVGTTIGTPTEKAKSVPLKPRIPFDSFAFEDVYNSKKVKEGVDQYEKIFNKYREENGMSDLPSYKEKTTKFYTDVYFNQTAKMFEKQGFKWSDKV